MLWIWLSTGLVAFACMELWAALLHRCVWHTLLWPIHRTHHRGRHDVAPASGAGRFELNDWLSAVHAPVAVALVLYGCVGPLGPGREAAYGFGLGMCAFGAAYVAVHDGLSHRRFPTAGLGRSRWLARVAAAHRVHHRTGEAPFGLFTGPWTLAWRKRRGLRYGGARVGVRKGT